MFLPAKDNLRSANTDVGNRALHEYFKRRRTVHDVAKRAGDHDLLNSGLDGFPEDVERSLLGSLVMA